MKNYIKKTGPDFFEFLKQKALEIRKETLRIHGVANETRLASSLSCVEIFVTLYYGGILNFNPENINWEERDRFIISKGHGSISFYPVLADLGYFDKKELGRVCKEGSFLGGIPDPVIPGYETINGSLGHGLGVACGMALALKRRNRKENVFVLLGDGELYEGSVWEAVMFSGEHRVDNLVLIIDNNKICMLDYCRNILDLEPIEEKFRAHKWAVDRVDGHDIVRLHASLQRLKGAAEGKPKVLIADTIKGKGVQCLEGDSLCHIKSLKQEDIDLIIEGLK
ncbi:MAG: transketolase [Thermodesulfovibrionales bacterium]|nr:transketolase [Thermodesulfovibrionales bacterium]